MSKVNSLWIIILFYLGWFGSVFAAQTKNPWQSLVFPVLLLSFLIFKKLLNAKHVAFAAFIIILGTVFDSLMAFFGLVVVHAQSNLLIPSWLFSIWVLFAFSMIKLGASFQLPIWAVACLGFVFGPLSYKSGEVFNVLFITSNLSLLIYAIFWALFFPFVISVSKRCA